MKQSGTVGVVAKAILLSCLVLVATACTEQRSAGQTIRIGFSVASDDFLLERWSKDVKIFSSRAGELGAEVILARSAGDALSQIPQIQYLLGQDIDVLVVIPQDMELLNGVIKSAMDRGIPVLAYDRPIMGVSVTGYVSFDNHRVGEVLAESLVEAVPQGRYLLVNGSERDNNSYEINRGMHRILDPHIRSGSITVNEELWLELWSFDEAIEKIEASLQRNPMVDAIFCANDVIAGAAVQILAQRRLAGQVAVVGQDADLLACQRIVRGTQLMTAYKPIPLLANRAAELAVAFARGQEPKPDTMFDNRSGQPIPFYFEQPVPVFEHNMEATIVADGFHARADIYLGMD